MHGRDHGKGNGKHWETLDGSRLENHWKALRIVSLLRSKVLSSAELDLSRVGFRMDNIYGGMSLYDTPFRCKFDSKMSLRH